MSWTLQYRNAEWEITDAAALEDRLKELHNNHRNNPAIVHLCARDGACLNIAVGNERSLLNYVAPGGWPARHSIGSDDALGFIEYEVTDEIAEFPDRCTIPFADALRATLYFYSTQRLADFIRWEDD